MRRIIALLLTAAFFISAATEVSALPEESGENPGYAAKAALVAEISTGQVLYAENATERLPIASVTKIMTLLLAAEAIKAGELSMDTEITASQHASSMEGSVIWLNAGEKMSASDIIRSVVISSANDACVALAEHLAGSEESFALQMNERAKSLGMTDTSFSDCTGLTEGEGNYSTAADVAKMAAELRKYSYFDEFLLTRLTYVREGTDRAAQLVNTNKLLNKYEGLTGLKTGTTDSAGYCFVATAKRDGMELVAVVLGAAEENERFAIARELLDYGFEGFELFIPEYDAAELSPLALKGGVKKTVAVVPEGGHGCLVPKGRSGDVAYIYDLPESLEAPLPEGSRAGKIIVLLDKDTLFLCEVKTSEEAEELTLAKCIWFLLNALFCF